MSKIFIGIIFFVSQFSFSEELSDFEKMLSGFPECNFDGVYIDFDSKLPVHSYFIARNMKPDQVDVEMELFSFKVNEIFYGLRVEEIFLSSNFHGTNGIIFSDSIEIVKDKMRLFLRHGFNKESPNNDFVVPKLERYHLDKGKTILFCEVEY